MYIDGQESFNKALAEVDQALSYCEANGLLYPTLLIVYSLIDSFSYIHQPNSDQRAQFEGFVNKWIVPHDEIQCTASELYAARNAVLHRLGTQSRLTETNKADTIAYCKGDADFSILQEILEPERRRLNKRFPALRVESLVNATRVAIQKTLEEAKTDRRAGKRLEDYLRSEQPFRFQAETPENEK